LNRNFIREQLLASGKFKLGGHLRSIYNHTTFYTAFCHINSYGVRDIDLRLNWQLHLNETRESEYWMT